MALTPALLVEGGQLQQLLQQRPQLGQVIQRREPRKQRRAAPLNNFGASDEPHDYASRPHRLPTPVHESPILWWPPMAGLCLRKHDGWLHALQRALIGHRLPLLRSNWSISSEVPPTARRGWLLRELALRSCLSQLAAPSDSSQSGIAVIRSILTAAGKSQGAGAVCRRRHGCHRPPAGLCLCMNACNSCGY